MKKYDRLIFVSNSDTCRGPMAEAILKSKFLLSELEVESRGLVVLFPEPVNQKAEAILASHGLTMKDHTANPSDAGGSWRIIVAFPLAAYGYAKTTQWACGERNVPVMLGIQLSRCWVIIIDYQAKSVKIVSRIFLISSGTYSNALCNASA